MRALQLTLPFTPSPDLRAALAAIALASGMLCERMRCRVDLAQCIAWQTGEDPRTAVHGARKWVRQRDPFCRSGRCKQGLGVLLQAHIMERKQCPGCGGCGWVPRAKPGR